MTTINDLIPRYWDYLEKERLLRPATCTGYIGDLRQLAHHLHNMPVEAITRDDLRGYQRAMKEAGKAVGTIRRALHGFSTFWGWLALERIATDEAVRGLIMPRRRRKEPVFMSEDELRTFASTPTESARESLAWVKEGVG